MPFGAAHTYIAYTREYLPSRDAITLHLCKVFHRTTVLLIITTTVLTNKRHMSQSICTENFDNLFIQRRELITLTKIRVKLHDGEPERLL